MQPVTRNRVLRYWSTKKYTSIHCLLLILVSSPVLFDPTVIEAVKIDNPAKEEKNEWVARFWNWRPLQSPPEDGGCIMNDTRSVVMLMEPLQEASNGNPIAQVEQNCTISSNQRIMIPMWVAWCDTAAEAHKNFRGKQLAECARDEFNKGHIVSSVSVDNATIAKLNVRNPPLTYVEPPTNITEFISDEFTLRIPTDAKGEQGCKPPEPPCRAGSHGWWVFLEELPPGKHTIFYQTEVTPIGPEAGPIVGINGITYSLQVNPGS